MEERSNQEPASQSLANSEILAAIWGTREALESKMDLIVINVNKVRLDLCKVPEGVSGTEKSISTLQQEVKTLQTTVADLRSKTAHMEERLENAEGCSRHNNISLIGFPEQGGGPSVELTAKEASDWMVALGFGKHQQTS
ncbi:hypothetical protein NDU88_008293 [Pleurodeles waltl]|uniref:Uncharacterized protein n=1 Tax=Pleurodeles waltl TaxID=8319 RepID=A0AAV7PTZ0_PLEWA|nr:hypothetical protein NDU88_008293 [Pleurodeles waltl]